MAVMDHDAFSSISWHEDQNDGAVASSSAPEAAQEPLRSPSSMTSPDGMHHSDRHHRVQPSGPNLGNETLECTVSKPQKENDGTKDAYVSYLITTHSSFSIFQKPITRVRRRFTDFVFLFKSLSRLYPACAVPPLPDKQRMEYVTGDRFGTDFTQRRSHSLHRFLSRITLHHELRRAPILHTFLESAEWNASMRSQAARSSVVGSSISSVAGNGSANDGGGGGGGSGGSSSGSGGGVFENLTDNFMNAFTKAHKLDRRFIEVRERSDKLDEDLAHVEKVIVRVARRESDLEADFRDLAEQFQRLTALEPGVGPAARAFATGVEDSATGLRRLREHTDQDYLGSLRDMTAYSGALKSLLRAREQKQLDHEQLTGYLQKATQDRDLLNGGYSAAYGAAGGFLRSKLDDVRGLDHEQSRRDRQRKLELQIENLTTEVEAARNHSEIFDEKVIDEVAIFERIKRIELKRQLGALADAHVEFYTGIMDVWGRYVRDIEREESGNAPAA